MYMYYYPSVYHVALVKPQVASYQPVIVLRLPLYQEITFIFLLFCSPFCLVSVSKKNKHKLIIIFIRSSLVRQ